MTSALCLYCGNVKFGALCPCDECGEEATGDPSLDIVFSDHQIPVEKLELLGAYVRGLRLEARGNSDVTFWSFIQFISDSHGYILNAEVPSEYRSAVAVVYGTVPPPTLELA